MILRSLKVFRLGRLTGGLLAIMGSKIPPRDPNDDDEDEEDEDLEPPVVSEPKPDE